MKEKGEKIVVLTPYDYPFETMADEAGISVDDAFKVLNPLIKGTLSNIENVGTIKALTGPIARGDSECFVSKKET